VSEQEPLVEQVLASENVELRILAAQGVLPLSPEQLIPLQVALAGSEDPMIAGYAATSLQAVEPRFAHAYLTESAPPEVLSWFALHHGEAQLVETVLRRRDVPRELLAEVAASLAPDLQETLLLRQDAIVELPAILDALERNERLSIYARRRIAEYRQHLLPRAAAEEAVVSAAEALAAADLDAADLREIEAVREAVPAAGEVDEKSGLSESQVRSLPVPVRIKLSKGASRTLRNILIRDSNRLVALAVLANSAMSEDEIEQVAGNRSIDDEVLTFIARRREWVSRYGICRALVLNPRVPVGIGVRLTSRLSVRDLKVLRKDRNVSEPVRASAERLYRIKSV
jgi:hypothetical protein